MNSYGDKEISIFGFKFKLKNLILTLVMSCFALIMLILIDMYIRDVSWYGVIIGCGFLIAIVCAIQLCKERDLPNDFPYDLILWVFPLSIICARLYYVICSPHEFDGFMDVIAVWEGGIAIYGGIIGALISAAVFCKIKKIKFLDLCDYLVPFLALGQSIGRWGNFVNQEAYGYITESFLKMRIYSKEIGGFINVHPTFLYESILDFLIFGILIILRKKRKFSGQLLYVYFILYGIGRAIIEGFRTDSLMMMNFRISQVFSIFLVIISIILYYFGEKCRRKD